MATRVSLVYRCRLPGGSKAGLPVFVDLRSARTGPLADRVGLGRLLTLARVIESPVSVEIADRGDLADPLDQQVIAALLAPSGSQLVVAGATIRPRQADLSDCGGSRAAGHEPVLVRTG